MPQNFIKFYGNDWRADPRLRMCSMAARGLWIDMITFMMEAEPFGHLLINGVAPTPDQIGRLTCSPPTHVKKALSELEQVGVFSRTEEGVIFSRRMLRDAARSEEGRQWVNKRLDRVPTREPSSPPSSPPATQKPEARSQKPENDASASFGAPKEKSHERSRRGIRLAADWQPSPEDRDFAATLELDPDEVAAEFRDYWCGIAGSKGAKLDWSGTYRNRCRELATRGKRGTVQRFGPATGIAQGFADALRMGDGEPDQDRRPHQPPPIALLGGQRG